ncbi:6-phosphogluconolactonase, eukaryotic type [Marinobacter excellens LAMA 842]|jgi:6-phosphogluconolactonase|uniref:6-phosphogluconolactonase n=2 Tax=Marinobacter TaxID=2742 RepID=A0A137SGP5_9GAMM|nr:6-phosphogluconolactonase, eukaryotic type [Marinobacter excellens LAMA 842]
MKMPDMPLPDGVTLESGEDPQEVAEALAADVARFLVQRLERADRASLVVSGGSTPLPFFRALSQVDLDWSRVDVLLADERWVPEGDPASNTTLVRENLLQNKAADANFLSLKQVGATPEEGLPRVRSALAGLKLPLDVLILGMGNDGHTASLFPDAPELPDAMDLESRDLVLAMNPPSQAQQRITLTRPVLAGARYTALHLKGNDKLDTLAAAMARPEAIMAMPVRAFLKPGLKVFWSP